MLSLKKFRWLLTHFILKGELDDIVFRLAAINHFGKYIQSVAQHVDKVTM